MKMALILLALGWAVWAFWMYKQIKNAPLGYEKNNKFYYGKEPINEKYE